MSSAAAVNRHHDGDEDEGPSATTTTTTTTQQPTPAPTSAPPPPPVIRRTVSTVSDANVLTSSYEPSISLAVFVTWILPVIIIAIMTRFAVDKDATFVGPASSSRPIAINFNNNNNNNNNGATAPTVQPTTTINKINDDYNLKPLKPRKPSKEPTPVPTILQNKPTNYIDVVQAIESRRLDWGSTESPTTTTTTTGRPTKTTTASSSSGSSTAAGSNNNNNNNKHRQSLPSSQIQQDLPPPRGASSDPVRMKMMEQMDQLRNEYTNDATNLYKLLDLADLLRMYDVQYHDGGSVQKETIERYQKAIELALDQKRHLLEKGQETNRNHRHGTINVNEEIMLDYKDRSIDGILCAAYTALGKSYFMANMFERAVTSYTQALEVEPLYLDAMSARGSARIILGQYADAAEDFSTTMQHDHAGRFLDVYTGLARVLQARESAVPQGWSPMIDMLEAMIPALEVQHANLRDSNTNPQGQTLVANTLNRLYHVLFLYHDVKTLDTDAAFRALTKSYDYKMSALPAWNAGFESQKIAATKQIFHRGFWPEGVGSPTSVPVFIIGFVRSGSTLLERVLDAHPQIVGTGENSVFNGRLDAIRNTIVEVSLTGDSDELKNVISSLADGVVDEMKQRWNMVASAEDRAVDQPDAERYVDKMLTNYYNVGFIHMLFPNALILHVAREPMDTIFSAYKHEFPSGTLDYTSQFDSLAELYHAYRDVMEHWDRVLPGRVTHIRYEDMVHDMPNIARKIIDVTGLEWDDSVLDFHKKKQAVNTLSTTQVRKGIYKDSLQAWKRYETHLSPLVKLIGPRTNYDLKTSLKGYAPPHEGVNASDETVGQVDSSQQETLESDGSQDEL